MTARAWWHRLVDGLTDRRRVRRETPFTASEMADLAAEVRKAREARA